ncbi:hypothetical protein RSP03_01190 [Cereibacter sphaeroides]|jgi:hypothetical protein|nr:hypothetical protein [Cereibacter sphaeroides]GEM91052.1 hypothetical protein RSP03_01190 [Cereibacter sphaeroides]
MSVKSWRRVPESNRSSRICNPVNSIENKEPTCKRTAFVHDEQSSTYEASVNAEVDQSAKKNPDALAGAVGADSEGATGQEGNPEAECYPNRGLRAIALYRAIWAAHPHDAADIMTEELLRLSAGTPPHDVFGRVREDARWWAAVASPVELVEYMAAAMRAILGGRTALCLDQRKRLMVETWHSLPDAEKQAFLDRVAPHAEEGRRRG